ncbi:MAG: hypothetical protein WCJ30_10475, partial [Deltaproteobacteria bacterium]
IGAVEAQSEHPLGRALVAHAQGLASEAANALLSTKDAKAATEIIPVMAAEPPTGVAATRGGGLTASLGGQAVVLGSARFVGGTGVRFDASATADLESFDAAAYSAVCVAVEGRLEALLGLADALRPEAKAAVAALRALGMRDAFVPGVADFSGMDGTRHLFVQDVMGRVVDRSM